MLNGSNNPTVQFTWQALLWRLLLTLLLLSALAGPGLTLFRSVTNLSITHKLGLLFNKIPSVGHIL
jgi:hypothetical protein